ncbi:MAG: 16S rRNA (cytosine(1402)-N(4))-methyltransferase RsmH [Bacteroidales bacterium]|jgi:16S rRNA (cytosine1402-N4)-methyltransferase
MSYHVPVMLEESLQGLAITPDGVYVDVTFGGGGHSRAILERLDKGRLLAFDQDADAMKNRLDDERFIFVKHNFRFLKNFLEYHHFPKVDGILADLGVSSHHFDVPERGFSFREEGPLDMRMNTEVNRTAADVLNEKGERELIQLFRQYGELKSARRIAGLIVKARESQPFVNSSDLLSVLEPILPQVGRKKVLAKIFQALRIEVNEEMRSLEQFLLQTASVLKPGGRLVVITYHSLEDRMVKNVMRSGKIDGTVEKDIYGQAEVPFKVITRKVILPNEMEITENPRSRSAKLRIAEKL